MICGLCLKKVDRASVTAYGVICPQCLPNVDTKEKALYAELLEEDAVSMPPLLDVDAFERLMLKFALHYLSKIGPEHQEHLRKTKPILLWPRTMALWMKEKVVDKIPLLYVSSMNAEGREALFHGGTYEFKKSVPDSVVLEALRKAGFITVEGEGA